MHPFRPMVLGGVGFSIVATLLPFASFPVAGTLDGLAADAWPALVLLAPVAAFTFLGPQQLGWSTGVGITAVVLAAGSFVLASAKVADASRAVGDVAGASLGPGSWVLAASTLVTLLGTVLGALARR